MISHNESYLNLKLYELNLLKVVINKMIKFIRTKPL